MRDIERFSSRELRDARARELRSQGFTVRKSSTRNVCIDPRYLRDIGGPDLGLANTTQFFAAVYTVETTRW